MSFKLVEYEELDFSQNQFVDTPDTVTVPAPKDKVTPERHHTTTIFPEYFEVKGQRLLAEESRMDCMAVYENGRIYVREFRDLRQRNLIFTGKTESCEDGIFVYPRDFSEREGGHDEVFTFRQRRSRETAFSRDYDNICELFHHEWERGYMVWVMELTYTFNSDSREAFSKLVMNRCMDALLAGNVLATHDLEEAYLNTALGQNIYTQYSQPNDRYNHIDIINRVEFHGFIPAFVGKEGIDSDIVYSCVKKDVPFVLVDSIRDDGSPPEVYANVYRGRDTMRNCVRKATTVICMAITLHSIATGDMTPSFRVIPDGAIHQVYFYSIDVSEFAMNELGDRGSPSAKSIVTNVQDFVMNVSKDLGLWRLEYAAFQGVIMRVMWL